MMQLDNIDASKEIDAIENHLLSIVAQLQLPAKTNEKLSLLTTSFSILTKLYIDEMRFNRGIK
jgi:hypothetical protein